MDTREKGQLYSALCIVFVLFAFYLRRLIPTLSTKDFFNRTINPPNNQIITHSIKQSINQSINQMTNQSINKSIKNLLINKSIKQFINQSINPSITPLPSRPPLPLRTSPSSKWEPSPSTSLYRSSRPEIQRKRDR